MFPSTGCSILEGCNQGEEKWLYQNKDQHSYCVCGSREIWIYEIMCSHFIDPSPVHRKPGSFCVVKTHVPLLEVAKAYLDGNNSSFRFK